MKVKINDILMAKWLGTAMLLTVAFFADAQKESDSLRASVTGLEKIGVIVPPAEIKMPLQSDALSFAELLPSASGVNVTESGAVGAAPVLMIKGLHTINLNGSPQIFVDGIPIKYSGSIPSFLSVYEPTRFGFLNINDIKSMYVLKDAAAQGLLGGRGANGAVFLATDRGAFGGTKIEFTANAGFLRANYNVDRMGAGQFKNYLQDYMLANGATDNELTDNPVFSSTLSEYNENTDWIKMISRPARYNDYHIKLKGGSGDANYMFSVGHTKKQETLENTDFHRTTMRFNLDYQLSSKFEISNNLSYSNTGSRYLEEGYNRGIHPLYVAATKAPFLGRYAYNAEDVRTNLLADVDVLEKSNPWALVENMKNSNEENRVDGIISGKLKVKNQYTFNTSLSVSYYNLKESQYRPGLGIVADENRIRQNANRNSSEFMLLWNSFVNKSGTWGRQVKYEGQLGTWMETYEDKALYARKVNAGTDDYETLKQGTVDSASNVRFRSNLSRFYVSGNFDLFDRVNIVANFNTEGSSNFGPKQRWGLYGGANLVWDITKRADPFNFSLLASWGRSGNSDIRGYYQYNLYYATHYFGYGGAYLGNVANEDIRPEITNAYDASLRIGFLKNRLELNAGYYYRRTKDLITYKNFPIELGQDVQVENNGTVSSKGIELSLNAKIIETQKLSWVVYGNVSTLKNKVEELNNGDIIKTLGNVSSIARVKESLGSFYGYKIKGVFATDADVNLKKADGTNYMAGDYIVEDINGDGKINESDKQIIGNALPELYGGFGSAVSYKRISLDARFTFSCGQQLYNSFNQQMHVMSDYSNQSPSVNDRWKSASEPGNGLSRAAYGDPSNNGAASDLWIEDGSYTRLKLLTLSYDVPLKNRISFIKGLKINISGENLFTITSYSGMDPEVVSSSDVLLRGIDFGASPLPKSFVFGVKLSL
ncbi:MAG: SusC/RagA family TonB-linked outer membrane protein [Niabella sp.]